MGKTMIITDSGCDIPKNMLTDNIRVIPYTICLGEDESVSEDKINKKVFSQHIKLGFKPIGSYIEKSDVLDILNGLDEEYDEIVFITSSGMIYPSNEIIIKEAALEYFGNHICSKIAIIDSNTISMALGFLVLDAAKMAESGWGIEEIVRYVRENKSKYHMEFVANDPECLRSHKIISSRKAKLVENHRKNYLISMSRYGFLRPIMGRSNDYEVKRIMIDRLIDNYSDNYAIVSSTLNHEDSYFAEYIGESSELRPVTSKFNCSNTTFVGTDTISLCYKKKK